MAEVRSVGGRTSCAAGAREYGWEKGGPAFEQKNRNLAQIEVDEVLCFMCHIAAKISAHNAVPSGVVLFVKFVMILFKI